jgi:UDP-N-acetylmuramoyl-tripeptide--D-alanyl-D-alanine ligase
MQSMSVSQIVSAVSGTLLCGKENIITAGVSTDTRTLSAGELFLALPGENFDGHAFVIDAVKKGAGMLIVSEPIENMDIPVILVDDTLKALGDLAFHARSRFSGKIFAVTGSTGKTATKDMIAALLEQKGSVLKTAGNFNNEVGLPLTLLGLKTHHAFAVVEMGMRGLGQIAHLSDIAKPDVGVITNVNETHIELLGSKEQTAHAKSELVLALPPTGLAVLNRDIQYTWAMRTMAKCPVRSFGLSDDADVRAENIRAIPGEGTEFYLITPTFSGDVFLSVPGFHNVLNALAAVCAVFDYGVDFVDIVSALSHFNLTEGRTNILALPRGVSVVDDTYNSSPVSAKAALALFNELPKTGRRIAVLGDMLELGDYAKTGHRDVGKACVDAALDLLITVGPLSRHIWEGALEKGFPDAEIIEYPDSESAAKAVSVLIKPGDTILIKGSRGMRMERIVRALQREIVDD